MKIKILNGKKIFELTKKECVILFENANHALENTYPNPNKGFAVALMTEQGNVYTGISYQSNTETLTMHSEATALAHAAIHGETNIAAITGPNCHICKQLIYESSIRSDINTVIVLKEGDKIKQIPISELMPYAWPEGKTSD